MSRTLTWRRSLSRALILLAIATLGVRAQGQGSAGEIRQVRATSNAAPANATADAVQAQSRTGYLIGPGDILTVNVWNEPGITGKVPVRPDGMITLPLVGDVQAGGQTTEKLQASITQRLMEYVKQPSVTVSVDEMNSRQFNVMGEVQHPGSFTLSRQTRILDALAQAGGMTELAKTSKVSILRRDANGSTSKLPFNYKRVTEGKDLQANVELQTGDTVIVP